MLTTADSINGDNEKSVIMGDSIREVKKGSKRDDPKTLKERKLFLAFTKKDAHVVKYLVRISMDLNATLWYAP